MVGSMRRLEASGEWQQCPAAQRILQVRIIYFILLESQYEIEVMDPPFRFCWWWICEGARAEAQKNLQTPYLGYALAGYNDMPRVQLGTKTCNLIGFEVVVHGPAMSCIPLNPAQTKESEGYGYWSGGGICCRLNATNYAVTEVGGPGGTNRAKRTHDCDCMEQVLMSGSSDRWLHFGSASGVAFPVRSMPKPEDWVKSVDSHNDMRLRMSASAHVVVRVNRFHLIQTDLPGLPKGCGERDEDLMDCYATSQASHVWTSPVPCCFVSNIDLHGAEELSTFLGRSEVLCHLTLRGRRRNYLRRWLWP